MPSQALIVFNQAIDTAEANVAASAFSAQAKTAFTNMLEAFRPIGERLYLAGGKEFASDHVRFHLLAEYAQRTPDAQLTATRDFIIAVLDRVKNANDSLALSIAAGLD